MKTTKQIKQKYLKFISNAPDTLKTGKKIVVFAYLYKFVWSKISRDILLQRLQELKISGLAIAFLVEEIERKKDMFKEYKLSKKYGL